MSGNFKRENREIPSASQLTFDWERSANVSDGKADVHAAGKSDGSVVPANSANNGAAEAPAESREGRDPAERNAGQPDCRRTPSRIKRESRGLHGVREAARQDRTLKFTALLHHVSEDCLREAFFELKKTAAVGEDGEWSETKVGTPQGAVLSPLLANVFLHYVFDLWIEWWRTHHAQGDVVVVRYADDFVIGFQHQSEAQDCREALRQRFAQFGLTLHDEKTRLIEFGRYAAYRRKSRGAGRPETFDFLGFTHYCATTRHGRFKVGRRSIAKRVRRTLAVIKEKLRRRLHRPPGETGRWLGRVTRGWLNYHAIPDNSQALGRFLSEVERLWLQSLRRRSQKGRDRWTWARLTRLAARYLPRPRIQHPWPHVRFRARLPAGAV